MKQLSAIPALSLASAALLASVLTGCGKSDNQAAMAAAMAGQALPVTVMTVAPGSSDSEISFPATIKGKTDIAVRPQVTGFITKVHVDEGQAVRKGQVLFTLDQVQFQAAVDQAKAAVAAAETAVSNAQLTRNNKKKLYDKNIISEYEYQLAENQLATANAQLAQARAGLVTAQKNLAYTVVTAPSDGVVGTIPNREGSLASPSSQQPLTTVSDNSQVYAYFSLTERDLLDMSSDGRSLQQAIAAMPAVRLRLADGTLFGESGKVATVSGVIDSSTGAASVRALFNNPGGTLRSGSTGNVVIPRSEQNVIVIPQKATYELQDRKFVYVVTDSNTVVSAPVLVTDNNDGRTYVVTQGLEPGQRIVTEGVGATIKEGMKIQPVDSATMARMAAERAAAAGPQGRPAGK